MFYHPLRVVKYWNAITGVFILRIARECTELVWSTLSLTTRVDGHAAVIRVLHVSGSLKKCQQVHRRFS